MSNDVSGALEIGHSVGRTSSSVLKEAARGVSGLETVRDMQEKYEQALVALYGLDGSNQPRMPLDKVDGNGIRGGVSQVFQAAIEVTRAQQRAFDELSSSGGSFGKLKRRPTSHDLEPRLTVFQRAFDEVRGIRAAGTGLADNVADAMNIVEMDVMGMAGEEAGALDFDAVTFLYGLGIRRLLWMDVAENMKKWERHEAQVDHLIAVRKFVVERAKSWRRQGP